jgi:hypothetical protein
MAAMRLGETPSAKTAISSKSTIFSRPGAIHPLHAMAAPRLQWCCVDVIAIHRWLSQGELR